MSDLTKNNISREQLQEAAEAARAALPPDHGFILLAAPFGDWTAEASVEAKYVSNVRREDAIAILKTMLFRWGHNEEWMKSIS